MKVRDIMTPNPGYVLPTDPVVRAASLMKELDVGIVPVVGDTGHMRLEGVITDRDIAVRCVAAGHEGRCRVRDHMTADHLDTVRADEDFSVVVSKMETDRVRRIPVVSEDGRLVGIIAQADLATKLGPKEPLLVEEVVARISEPTQ